MKVVVVLVAVVSLAMAGCLQDKTTPVAPGAPHLPAPSKAFSMPQFSAPVQVVALPWMDADAATLALGKQLALFEPTLAFGPNGSYFVSAPYCPASDGGCSSHPSGLWRGPAPFVDLRPPVEAGVQGNGDSDVLWREGRLYFVDQGGGMHIVYASLDDGVTWSRSVSAEGSPDRPWIAASPAAIGVTFYREGSQLVSRSTDFGQTWDEATIAETTYPGGRLVIIENRTWVVPLLQDQNELPGPVVDVRYCGPRTVAVELAVSQDDGLTWNGVDTGARFEDAGEQALQSCAPSSTVPVFASAGQSWSVAWSEADAGGQAIGFVASQDAGATWGSVQRPFGTAGATIFPWLASRGPGDLVLAALRSPRDADANVNPGPWTLVVAWSGDGGSTWQEQDLGFVHDGPVCTGGGGCRSTDRSLGDFVQGAVAPDGRLGITWTADLQPPQRGTQALVAFGLPSDEAVLPSTLRQ